MQKMHSHSSEERVLILCLVLIVDSVSDRNEWLCLAALTLADAAITYQGVSTGEAREVGPLMGFSSDSSFGEILGRKVLLQAGYCGVLILVNRIWDKDIPVARSQCWMNGVVVSWNLTQVKVRW